MSIDELVLKNRSYRRFYENHPITRETLENLVNLARLSPSAGNRQPLRYILSCSADINNLIFPTLSWAAYLKDWVGPAEGERPSAYIIIVSDSEWATPWVHYDAGIACQSILLGASEQGLGGCIIGAVQKEKLRSLMRLSDRYEILLVVALGKPREIIEIEAVQNENIKYWRDKDGVHHVPKRHLTEIILG